MCENLFFGASRYVNWMNSYFTWLFCPEIRIFIWKLWFQSFFNVIFFAVHDLCAMMIMRLIFRGGYYLSNPSTPGLFKKWSDKWKKDSACQATLRANNCTDQSTNWFVDRVQPNAPRVTVFQRVLGFNRTHSMQRINPARGAVWGPALPPNISSRTGFFVGMMKRKKKEGFGRADLEPPAPESMRACQGAGWIRNIIIRHHNASILG